MMTLSPFHIAIPTDNLDNTRAFYGKLLGCIEGRSAEKWIDYNFFGHQLSVHLKPDEIRQANHNPVDGKDVPIRHFGVVLPWNDWHQLADKLKAANIDFVIEPYIRFKGEVGEQATMFFMDPSQNALEFKAFKDIAELFSR